MPANIPSGRLTKAEAEGQGYIVDTTVYPWFGYKGGRFNPTHSVMVFTTLEEELMEDLAAAAILLKEWEDMK